MGEIGMGDRVHEVVDVVTSLSNAPITCDLAKPSWELGCPTVSIYSLFLLLSEGINLSSLWNWEGGLS